MGKEGQQAVEMTEHGQGGEQQQRPESPKHTGPESSQHMVPGSPKQTTPGSPEIPGSPKHTDPAENQGGSGSDTARMMRDTVGKKPRVWPKFRFSVPAPAPDSSAAKEKTE